ncbi:MAG: hypothetical protein ACLFR0_04745 [Alphaproteobacteria bacterium]
MECDGPSPRVQVKMFKKKTDIVRSFSTGHLTHIHTGAYRPNSNFVLGLGGGNFALNAKMKFTIKTKDQLSCVRLDHIMGHFTIKPLMMIAREYRKGTCEYNAVLEHERKHVAALEKFQRHYARKFKSRLKEIARNINTAQVVSATQAEISKAQIEEQITREIQNYVEQITPIIQQRQIDIDNPQEYRRVYAQCDGWDG